MSPELDKKIGVIGCGSMGTALIGRLAHIMHKGSLIITDLDKTKRERVRDKCKVRATDDNATLIALSDIIILAIKPKDYEALLSEIRDLISEKKLVISIAAGTTTAYIERLIRKRVPVIRVMPNMPAIVGEAISTISAGSFAKPQDMKMAREIFSSIGEVVEVGEEMVDAVTAVSGSGPAYFFYLVECMIEAARDVGLNEEAAVRLVLKTALGSAKLLNELKETPADLRAKVTSKGGTTEAAFEIFGSRHFKEMVKEAVAAACKRSKELSKR